jgi:hypothetical protein
MGTPWPEDLCEDCPDAEACVDCRFDFGGPAMKAHPICVASPAEWIMDSDVVMYPGEPPDGCLRVADWRDAQERKQEGER